MDSYSTIQGLHFSFLHQCSRIKNFFYSTQYHTALSQYLELFSILNFEYLSENETKIENILTPWSVAQAGMNDEKN